MKCSQVGLAGFIGPSVKDLGSETDFSSSILTFLALTIIFLLLFVHAHTLQKLSLL